MSSRIRFCLIFAIQIILYTGQASAGPNANAVVSLDLIAESGAGNRTDDGITSGTVSGQGATIAIEIFATGVKTSINRMILKFEFDDSLLSYIKAENSAFQRAFPVASVGTNFWSSAPVTLTASGFLARAEFKTVVDVTGREFSIGIATVTVTRFSYMDSTVSTDNLTTPNKISFNATVSPDSTSSPRPTPSPDFDGDGTVGMSDFISFESIYGTQTSDAAFDAQFDLDGDGAIGFLDLIAFASRFGETVEPTPQGDNRQPVAAGAIAAQSLTVGGAAATVDVSGYFSDPDGDALTFSAVSTDTAVAAVTVSDLLVAITPKAAGNAKVTVTATDPGGLSAEQTIDVTVAEPTTDG